MNLSVAPQQSLRQSTPFEEEHLLVEACGFHAMNSYHSEFFEHIHQELLLVCG
jgi:hypothetical protein